MSGWQVAGPARSCNKRPCVPLALLLRASLLCRSLLEQKQTHFQRLINSPPRWLAASFRAVCCVCCRRRRWRSYASSSWPSMNSMNRLATSCSRIRRPNGARPTRSQKQTETDDDDTKATHGDEAQRVTFFLHFAADSRQPKAAAPPDDRRLLKRRPNDKRRGQPLCVCRRSSVVGRQDQIAPVAFLSAFQFRGPNIFSASASRATRVAPFRRLQQAANWRPAKCSAEPRVVCRRRRPQRGAANDPGCKFIHLSLALDRTGLDWTGPKPKPNVTPLGAAAAASADGRRMFSRFISVALPRRSSSTLESLKKGVARLRSPFDRVRF